MSRSSYSAETEDLLEARSRMRVFVHERPINPSGDRKLVLMEGQVVGGTLENPSLAHIRPIDREFFDAIDAFIRDQHHGCPCKLTGAMMAALGAPYTAKMHLDAGREWSETDWFTHFVEEEVVLCPILAALGFRSDADEIKTDHDRYRRQVERGIPWDWLEIGRHAAREDKIIVRLRKKMEVMVG